MTENNIKEFPKSSRTTQDTMSNSEAYILSEILYAPQKMKTFTDFSNGNQRNRRWGIVTSFATVPGLDQIPVGAGPTLLPKSPSRFFCADTLSDLRQRVIDELDSVLEMARLAIEEPEKFEAMVRSLHGEVSEESDQNNDHESDMS